MLGFIFRKMHNLLNNNESVFSEADLLKRISADLKTYKTIDFYHMNAQEQLDTALKTVKFYQNEMNRLLSKCELDADDEPESIRLITEVKTIINQLTVKNKKLTLIQEQIPEGMLDLKRALYITLPLSSNDKEQTEVQTKLASLKHLLTNLNTQYTGFIQAGGALNSVLLNTTRFYWHNLSTYRTLLDNTSSYFKGCTKLTPAGQLAARCLANALATTPAQDDINAAIASLEKKKTKNKAMKKVGFYDAGAVGICAELIKGNKPLFYMPHNNSRYHFDYDPTADLIGTGGDCFGQSMVFMHSLACGKFKWLCPESGLINFQLDQSRHYSAKKATIGTAETEVSDVSEHDSLQWDDVHPMLTANENFAVGDICGLIFSMNAYTISQRSFTAGHIAVIARLDSKRSPYNYVVFEKEMGVFGVVDDASLELVIKGIMSLYEGMNYAKMKLVKYDEATDKTYALLNSLKPLTSIEPKSLPAVHSLPHAGGLFAVAAPSAPKAPQVEGSPVSPIEPSVSL